MRPASPLFPHLPKTLLVAQTKLSFHEGVIRLFPGGPLLLDGQPLAPLEASSLQHLTPAGRAHPGAKAVCAGALALLRLICSLRHASVLLTNVRGISTPRAARFPYVSAHYTTCGGQITSPTWHQTIIRTVWNPCQMPLGASTFFLPWPAGQARATPSPMDLPLRD